MNWPLLVVIQIAALSLEVTEKRWALYEARRLANSMSKPMLNIGSRSWMEAALMADVNLDIEYQPGIPNFVLGDAQDLSHWPDKHFGSIFASHVLEHVEDPARALGEWQRVAEYQVIAVPYWGSPHAWLSPQHRHVFIGSYVVRTWWP